MHFLQVEIDPAGGSTYTNMGSQELVSVPYALNSEKSDAVSGSTGYIPRFDAPDSLASSSIFYSGGDIGINDATPSYTLDVAGTVRGQSGLVSDVDVIAEDDLSAGDDVFAGGNISAGANDPIQCHDKQLQSETAPHKSQSC